MFELRPGTTILILAGSKQFSFASVAPHKMRFLFRQYCSAAVFRWAGGTPDVRPSSGSLRMTSSLGLHIQFPWYRSNHLLRP
jgi:hypothetical protein